MVSVPVLLLAFCDGDVRQVEIPDNVEGTENILDSVFHYGQNENQPRNVPSVSVGDVICLNGEYHRMAALGFEQLTPEQLEAYKQLPRRDRYWWIPLNQPMRTL